MNRWVAAAILTVACTKGQAPSGKHAWLIVESPASSGIDLALAHVEGRGVLYAAVQGSRLVVEVDPERTSQKVAVKAEGGCPVEVDRGELGDRKTVRRTLEPLFDFGPEQAQTGFASRFEITAEPRCPGAENIRLGWRVKSGAPLRDIVVTAGGRRFGARTERFVEALGPSAPWGVVPISPRTRGETLVEASWTNADGTQGSRTVRVSAAARARGLPNVTLGTRLYLGGEGFRVVATPTGARAAVEMNDGHATLVPDARGKWTLADNQGRLLRLVAGKYDETPLDCGRSDCHAATTEIARTSPMASILERGLDARFPGDYPACALGCHAVGEPGLDDGGFTSVLGELGRMPQDLARTGFHELPTALRRLGGVGCLGCHGPGAIPEESARFSILRADVCATCHDAPPRYGHVSAWRTSRMARADADPRVSAGAECARCHTTWGFLNDPKRRPPDGTAPMGIGCAACHAAHPASADRAYSAGTCADKLLRDVPVPALLDKAVDPRAERSRICFGCHSPRDDDPTPAATAAAVWAGRGGIDTNSGSAIAGTAPHAAVASGCIGCHRAGPPELERGSGHAFRVAGESCTQCHAPGRRDPQIRARAEALWSKGTKRAEPAGSSMTPHQARQRIDRSTPRGRALWNVALVLEDPAADAHNAPYARILLDAAEAALGTPSPAPPRTAGSATP